MKSLRIPHVFRPRASTTARWRLSAAGLAAGAFLMTLLMQLALDRFQGPPLVWPVNAAILAALLSAPRDARLLLLAAGMAGHVLASSLLAPAILGPVVSAGVHLLEIVTCLALLDRWCRPKFDLHNWRHLKAFGLAAGAIAPLVTAGVAAAIDPGAVSGHVLLDFAGRWAADSLGFLIVTPPVLKIVSLARSGQPPRVSPRSLALLAALTAVTILAFSQSRYPILFLVPPALLLVTLQLEMFAIHVGLLWVAAIVTLFTLLGSGPQQLLHGLLAERILTLQGFLLVCAHASLSVTVCQRRQRELEESLQDARETAETASRAKAEFLANMSHELRTPLTSVVGFARLIEQQPELSPTSRKHVRQVLEAGSALERMVKDVLDFAKLDAGELSIRMQPIAPLEVVKGTLDLLEPSAAVKGLTLSLDCRLDPDLMVEADGDRLRQILWNLVGNAVKFTDVGRVDVVLAHDGERLRIEVADTGPGVAADQQPLLFRRFTQVDGSQTRAHGGTGLGLAICKGLVEAMGGRIGVESAPGDGSRFWAAIPAPIVRPPTASEPIGEPAVASACDRHGTKVLVVDDHSANRELARLLLTVAGAEVHEARDGQEAVDIARGCAFDVILMDISMPRLDGMAAAAGIRQGPGPNTRTPILAFTAGVDELSLTRLSRADFAGLVAKPIDPNALIAAVQRASGRLADGEVGELTEAAPQGIGAA